MKIITENILLITENILFFLTNTDKTDRLSHVKQNTFARGAFIG